jgi:hypothetical protein
VNQQIAQLQDSDPEFARTLKRLRAASYGLAAAIVLAAGLGLWAVVVNSEQATQITKIQKTPCTLHPEGKACSAIKERLARHGSLKSPCIEHQRVEGTKGRNCPHFYVPPSQRQLPTNSKEAQNLGNGLGESTANQSPGGRGTQGGSISPPVSGPKPQKPPPQAESPPSKTDTETDIPPAEVEATTGTPAEVDQGRGQETLLVKPVFEDIGPIAEQVGEAADHALCPVSALGIHLCTE